MIIEVKIETQDKVKVVKMLNKLQLEQNQNAFSLLSYKIDGSEKIEQ